MPLVHRAERASLVPNTMSRPGAIPESAGAGERRSSHLRARRSGLVRFEGNPALGDHHGFAHAEGCENGRLEPNACYLTLTDLVLTAKPPSVSSVKRTVT